MTKISQCNKCQIGKGVHCDYYFPFDDSDCTHLKLGEDKAQEKQFSVSKYSCYLLIVVYLIVSCIGEWSFSLAYRALPIGVLNCFII